MAIQPPMGAPAGYVGVGVEGRLNLLKTLQDYSLRGVVPFPPIDDSLSLLGASLRPLHQQLPTGFTPLRNRIPRTNANGNVLRWEPTYTYNHVTGLPQLQEVSLVPGGNLSIEEAYLARVVDSLRADMWNKEAAIFFPPSLDAAHERTIEVVESPAVYDPSNPDQWRRYVRQLHRAGKSLQTIQRWCPALCWGDIVEALA